MWNGCERSVQPEGVIVVIYKVNLWPWAVNQPRHRRYAELYFARSRAYAIHVQVLWRLKRWYHSISRPVNACYLCAAIHNVMFPQSNVFLRALLYRRYWSMKLAYQFAVSIYAATSTLDPVAELEYATEHNKCGQYNVTHPCLLGTPYSFLNCSLLRRKGLLAYVRKDVCT